MIWLLALALLLAVLLGPGLWVRHVLRKYAEPVDRYAACGTGAELARHLLDRLQLGAVKVELTAQGDHYDPVTRSVRLSAAHHDGASLTAVTVAAHEVGHAIQHARGERLFLARQRLALLAMSAQRLAGVLLIATPVIAAVLRAPQAGALCLLLAVGAAALMTLVHLLTLPVEFDASFGKALPLLAAGNYLHGTDLPHARRILAAAALTYVAGSLSSLLNLARWLAVLRR
jgi:Zn-dependent membrane protease YugP